MRRSMSRSRSRSIGRNRSIGRSRSNGRAPARSPSRQAHRTPIRDLPLIVVRGVERPCTLVHLREIFSEYGEVVKAVFADRLSSRRVAFLAFRDASAVEKSIDYMDGAEIGEVKITVAPVTEQDRETVDKLVLQKQENDRNRKSRKGRRGGRNGGRNGGGGGGGGGRRNGRRRGRGRSPSPRRSGGRGRSPSPYYRNQRRPYDRYTAARSRSPVRSRSPYARGRQNRSRYRSPSPRYNDRRRYSRSRSISRRRR
ncbi:hypothetical protein IW136_004869 [Coemansia sp. RSA 678]|nr:hypothetical protein IW136_004869 [Coemansia sp. RSA 678]